MVSASLIWVSELVIRIDGERIVVEKAKKPREYSHPIEAEVHYDMANKHRIAGFSTTAENSSLRPSSTRSFGVN
jgi:hypothetical protein